MKILHVTDIHFNQDQMDWIALESAQADVVCITGDFIDSRYGCTTSIADQVDLIKEWLASFNGPVLICSGNHDQLGDNFDATWLRNIDGVGSDGSIVDIQGIRFGCAPYGETDFTRFMQCDVLLNHEPPARLLIAKQSGQDYGSRYLHKTLIQEDLTIKWILCGHVHSPMKHSLKYRGCCISNPGANLSADIPNHHWINL